MSIKLSLAYLLMNNKLLVSMILSFGFGFLFHLTPRKRKRISSDCQGRSFDDQEWLPGE